VIEVATFRGNPHIHKLVISNNLTLRPRAFQECSNLRRIEFQSNVFDISPNSFTDSYNLECIDSAQVNYESLATTNFTEFFATTGSNIVNSQGWCAVACQQSYTNPPIPTIRPPPTISTSSSPTENSPNNNNNNSNNDNNNNDNSQNGEISGGAVAAVVIVVVLVVAGVSIGLFMFFRRRGIYSSEITLSLI
jgi:hypothetical protein